MQAASSLPQRTSVCVECNKITVKSTHSTSLLKLNCKQAIYFLQKIIPAAKKLIDNMDVEGSTCELANCGRSEEETAQQRNIPRLLSKYLKIPNEAISKRPTSVRSHLLKYLLKSPTMVIILTKIFSNFGKPWKTNYLPNTNSRCKFFLCQRHRLLWSVFLAPEV